MLYKAPTGYTKTQRTIQSPQKEYTQTTPKILDKDIKYLTRLANNVSQHHLTNIIQYIISKTTYDNYKGITINERY